MQMKVSAGRKGMMISMKQTHEIAEAIKKKNADKALIFLSKVLEKKTFVPFLKYPSKGHKHGIPAGYPVKATKLVMELISELKSNAKSSGADESKVIITGYDLGRGGYARFKGGGVYRHGKRTNLKLYGSVEKPDVISKPEKASENEVKKDESPSKDVQEKKTDVEEAVVKKKEGEKKEEKAKEKKEEGKDNNAN